MSDVLDAGLVGSFKSQAFDVVDVGVACGGDVDLRFVGVFGWSACWSA